MTVKERGREREMGRGRDSEGKGRYLKNEGEKKC